MRLVRLRNRGDNKSFRRPPFNIFRSSDLERPGYRRPNRRNRRGATGDPCRSRNHSPCRHLRQDRARRRHRGIEGRSERKTRSTHAISSRSISRASVGAIWWRRRDCAIRRRSKDAILSAARCWSRRAGFTRRGYVDRGGTWRRGTDRTSDPPGGGEAALTLASPYPPSGSDCCFDLRWLRESFAEYSQLTDLLRAKLVVTLRKVSHRRVEPVLLIIRRSADDTALHDVLEHLVPRFLERSHCLRCASRISRLLFAH